MHASLKVIPTVTTWPLHKYNSFSVGELDPEHNPGLYDPLSTRPTGVDTPNVDRPKSSCALGIFTWLRVSVSVPTSASGL